MPALRHVVAGRVQVPVQPQPGVGQQFVEGVAKAGRAGHQAVARVGAAQAGCKVSDHYCTSGVGRWQGGAQPIRAAKALGAHLLASGASWAAVILVDDIAPDALLGVMRSVGLLVMNRDRFGAEYDEVLDATIRTLARGMLR